MGLVLYGSIAAGVALAISVDTDLGTAAVVGVVLVQLVGFFLAHAYADMLGERYDHPDRRLTERVSHACRHDVTLLLGGLPVIAIFAVGRLAGLGADKGADIALLAPILLLGGFGYLTARRGGVSRAGALFEAAFAAVLAAGVLLLKVLLH
jgi:hypothetical protein